MILVQGVLGTKFQSVLLGLLAQLGALTYHALCVCPVLPLQPSAMPLILEALSLCVKGTAIS